MALSAAHNTRKAACVLLVIAVLGAPSSAFSQRFDRDAEDVIESLQSEIQDIDSRDGPASSALIEPLTALGEIFRENDDHIPALAATQRAREVVRRNYGLNALEQAPLIRALIESEKALGRHAESWALEQELLSLARRHPDDLRTAEIFQATAERRMDLLDRYTMGEMPPELYLGCYYGAPQMMAGESMDCRSGSRGGVKRRIAGEAHFLYVQSANIILENERFESGELPSILNELVRSSYRFGNARLGERSISIMIAYLASNEAPLTEQVEMLARLADWKLLFADNQKLRGVALGMYEEIYEFIHDRRSQAAGTEALFAPKIPIVLPAFVENPLETERTAATRGHIDVAFDVTKFGKAEKITFADVSEGATHTDKRKLIRLILRHRFRPQVADDQFPATSRVAFRYFLND